MIPYCTNFEISNDGINAITNLSDFDALSEKDFNDYNDGIIVDAELNWEPYEYADFHGFKLIETIRTQNKYKGPIVICSPMPEKYFAEEKGCNLFESKVVNAPCHYFVEILHGEDHLQKAIEVLKTANWLDDVTLQQSVFNYFSVRDYVGTLLHDLRNKADKIESFDDAKKHIEEYFEIIKLQPIERTNLIHLTIKQDEILKQLLKTDEILKKTINNSSKFKNDYEDRFREEFRRSITLHSEFIKDLFGKEEKKVESVMVKRMPWQVMYVEDDIETGKTVKDWFLEKQVVCHLACNYQEAQEALEKDDITKKISAVISDYRLLKQGSKYKEEDIQGYTLLKKLKEDSSRPLAMFILTSKEGTIKNMARYNSVMNFSPQWFSKQDVLQHGGGFNLFYNELEKQANENFLGNYFQPDLDSWTTVDKRKKRSLKEYYNIHLQRNDYDDAEKIINNIVLTFLNNVKNGIVNGGGWKCTLLNDEDEKNLKSFREIKLSGRRIALALAHNGYERHDIYTLMTKKIASFEDFEDPNSKSFKDFKTWMSYLSLESDLNKLIPQKLCHYSKIQILKEEITFLYNYCNYGFKTDDFIVYIEPDDNINVIFWDIELLFDKNNLNLSASLKKILKLIEKNKKLDEDIIQLAFKDAVMMVKKDINIKAKFLYNYNNGIKEVKNQSIKTKLDNIIETL